MAETNNGPAHPNADCLWDVGGEGVGWYPVESSSPTSDPVFMFKLKFLVSDDRTLNCQFVPIRFYWEECGDNSLSSYDGSNLYVSDKIYDFSEYCDPFIGAGIQRTEDVEFPTYQGAQEECLVQGPQGKPPAERGVDFQNGGVDIVCSDSIDAPGDININGIAYEIADAVMFTNYFINGVAAFGTHIEGSIAASDANQDGVPLTVADLVYLIRVVVGDAQPYGKHNPMLATYSHENGLLNVSHEMGAAFVVFEGEVTPELLADMDMKYGYVSGNTQVLVYSTEANKSFGGEFLRADADLLSVEFATFTGQSVLAKNVPTSFRLAQNYPNPFNPATTIGFALPTASEWTLTVYNITGQVVETANGASEAGFVEYGFDASALASGIYFFKVVAAENTETKQMLLIK